MLKKNVLITGGSKGLGASIAKKFAENGYNIILNYNKSTKEANLLKKDLEEKYKSKVLLVCADISLENEVKVMIDTIKKEFNSIDILVNNAGIAIDLPLEEKSADQFMKVISVNLLGTFLVTKYATTIMNKGSIINISSTNGIDTGYIESIDYDASKAGVIALTHDFAKYLTPKIRVNCIAPGWINTDMNKNLFDDFKKNEFQKIGLKKFANCDDIANVVYFLASDNANYINDAVIRVDGGYFE